MTPTTPPPAPELLATIATVPRAIRDNAGQAAAWLVMTGYTAGGRSLYDVLLDLDEEHCLAEGLDFGSLAGTYSDGARYLDMAALADGTVRRLMMRHGELTGSGASALALAQGLAGGSTLYSLDDANRAAIATALEAAAAIVRGPHTVPGLRAVLDGTL